MSNPKDPLGVPPPTPDEEYQDKVEQWDRDAQLDLPIFDDEPDEVLPFDDDDEIDWVH